MTVDEIRRIPKQKVSSNTPRLEIEKACVALTGVITSIRYEDDGDIHYELRDSTSDSTIVCEVTENFPKVRSMLSTYMAGDTVTMIGFLFQDKVHSPSKLRTRNFIEIHPVIEIR
jgi:hypothetical protein